MKLNSIFTKEGRWCKHAIARDKHGKALNDINTFYLQRIDKKGNIYYQEFRNDDLAYSYSLHGAVIKAYNEDERESVMDKLREAIIRVTRKVYYVAQFNDAEETTFDQVKDVIAIAKV